MKEKRDGKSSEPPKGNLVCGFCWNEREKLVTFRNVEEHLRHLKEVHGIDTDQKDHDEAGPKRP